jgi:hypothetical protein
MPKGLRRLVISFGASSLTHYGGVYVLHRFLTRIGFKNALASDIRLAQRNNRYSVGEMLLALLYPMLLGLDRIETTQLLRQNGVFQYPHWIAKLSRGHDAAAVLAACCPDGTSEAPRFA